MPRRHKVIFESWSHVRGVPPWLFGRRLISHAGLGVGQRQAHRHPFLLARWLSCAPDVPTPFRAWRYYSLQVRRPAITLGISEVGPPASCLRPPVCLRPRTPKRSSSLCFRGNTAIIGLRRATGKGQMGSQQERGV